MTSSIEWTDLTWNPLRGCEKISAGCKHCYAETIAKRFSKPGLPYFGIADSKGWTGIVVSIPSKLSAPLRIKHARRIFVNSMSDVFHDRVKREDIAAIFGVMMACPEHTFQLLTKRPERMVEWFKWADTDDCAEAAAAMTGDAFAALAFGAGHVNFPPINLHLGVSVENQERADECVPLLKRCPAAVRWVSVEPLLEALDLSWHLAKQRELHVKMDIAGALRNRSFDGFMRAVGEPVSRSAVEAELNERLASGERYLQMCDCDDFDPQRGCKPKPIPGIDWVVVGCESGPHRRPCNIGWVRSIVDQCRGANVPVFVKQVDLGATVSNKPHEWPEDLRVRMFPGEKWVTP